MKYTKYHLGTSILQVYAKDKTKPLNKYNVLGGRGGYIGDIEYFLKTEFSSAERLLANQVMENLISRRLLDPTLEDLSHPADWLRITELGEQAIRTGALDELDNLLINLHSTTDLLGMRYGAYDAITSQHTDWQRHAATSCRELITHVLHTIAPDDEVRNDPAFKPNDESKNGITRTERIKFYLRKKEGSISKNDKEVIEKACELVEACYAKFSSITHTDKKDVENLISLSEHTLIFLLG